MSISANELISVRETTNAILDGLGLDTYLFELEPQGDYYDIKVECACDINGGWTELTIRVPRDKVIEGFDDLAIRQQLSEFLGKQLATCKRKKDL
jgi:hypothetical protein